MNPCWLAPGALHHVIIRGIERRKIFLDDRGRNDFLGRVGKILSNTGTACYAWSLLQNHARGDADFVAKI